MIFTATGRVVKVTRNLNGSQLSFVRVVHENSGQVVDNGKYSNNEDGFFDYAVWENNTMWGTRADFSKTMAALRPGSLVTIVADIVDRTVKDGDTTEHKIVLNAQRINFISSPKNKVEGTTTVEKEFLAEDSELQADFSPDPFE